MDNIILIVCCSILFFWRVLKYNYCSDDVPVFLATKDKHKDCWWKRLFWNIEGSIRINQRWDYCVTVLLHTLTCVFLYIGFGSSKESLLASFLFMINPSNNQGSIWPAGRGYVLPSLLLLMAISIPYLSPLFMSLVLYFHNGYLSSVMFIFYPFKWYVLFMPILWVFWFKRFRGMVNQKVSKEMFGEDKKIHPTKLILFFKTFGYYLTLCIFPFRTAFYHAYMQSMSGNSLMKKRAYSIDTFFFIGISSFIAMGYYIITHNNSMVSFGMAWFICGIAPYCNLFRVQQEIAERYCYLPLVGISFVLGAFLSDYTVLYAALLSCYATKLWFYIPAYQDDYYLAETACLISRDAWFPWHIRAMKRWDTGSYKEALTLWVMAKIISPQEFKVLWDIGVCLKVLRQDKEADEYINLAMQNVPLGQEEQTKELYANYKNGKFGIIL